MFFHIVELARLNKPTGFYLLFVPCTWSLALSDAPLEYWLIFFFGALFARSAGCAYNDLVDIKKDRLVTRTKTRPLASGKISKRVGFLVIALFAAPALVMLLLLPNSRIMIAMLSVPLILLYPFMKRIIWLPQLWLGITFNWGVFVAGGISLTTIFMYLGGIFWTLAYDTLYGFQDYQDDERAGVKSLPRLAGYERGLLLVSRFYMLAIMCWFIAGSLQFYNPALYYFFCIVAFAFSRMQIRKLDLRDSMECAHKFKLESIFGSLITVGIFLTHILL